MAHIDTLQGRVALTAVQAVAMIEIGALPLWMGALIGHYGFDPRAAGSMVSLYMIGAVLSGFVVAPLFGKLNSGRTIAAIGMALGATAFFMLSKATAYQEMAILHVFAGLSIGSVLAVSLGTVGRSLNPHRLFAITAVASSVIAAGFLGIMPSMVADKGGQFFFQIVSLLFGFGAITALLVFPYAPSKLSEQPTGEMSKFAGLSVIPRRVWYGFIGLFCLAVVFSMTMSFVERVGMDRNYGLAAVSSVLSVMAIVKLLPAALAGLLQKRLKIRTVLLAAPVVQALSSAAIFAVPSLAIYSLGAPIFIMPMLFAQVFAFGLISQLEPTGRATALSPSISMLGATVGPTLGGSIVKAAGYSALAGASFVIAAFAIAFFFGMTRGD